MANIIFLFNLLLLSSTMFFASAVLLEDVCRQTRDQAFCMKALGSDPRTANSDLTGLAQVTIDLASYSATGSNVKIHALYLSEKIPDLRERLGSCDDAYASALDSLRGAADYLKQSDFRSVNIAAAAVSDDGFYCEDALKLPPPFKSPLTNENGVIERFAEIIAVISNLL